MAARTRDRLARAERLVRVQEQMRQAAEIALAETRDRAAAVEADRARLLAALSDSPHGLVLLEAATRRLRGLAAEAGALAREAETRADILRERGLARKRAEAQAERRAEEDRREGERRDDLARLDALMARSAPGGDTSLR